MSELGGVREEMMVLVKALKQRHNGRDNACCVVSTIDLGMRASRPGARPSPDAVFLPVLR